MVAQVLYIPKRKSRKIPSNFIKEELRGKPLYYKGYKDVLNGKKQIEEIMGSSSLQSYLVSFLNAVIYHLIDRKKYILTTNETGLHLGHKNNLSTDIGIFLKEKVILTDKYFDIAPEIAIEVDVKIETDKELDYIFSKSEEMLSFGTKKILWIITKHKKIFVIEKGQTTQVVEWEDDIFLMENITLNLKKLLDEEEISY